MGVQELRRRCAVRHRRPGLRLARPDDERADDAPTARPSRPRPPTEPSRATTACTSRASRPPPTRSPRSSRGRAGCRRAGAWTAPPRSRASRETLERVCVETVESGKMTKDLALLDRPRAAVADDPGVPRLDRREPAQRDRLRASAANSRISDQSKTSPGDESVSNPVRVTVTGAAGQIGYSHRLPHRQRRSCSAPTSPSTCACSRSRRRWARSRAWRWS